MRESALFFLESIFVTWKKKEAVVLWNLLERERVVKNREPFLASTQVVV